KTDEERSRVMAATAGITQLLAGVRVRVDDRDEYRPGRKFNEWELKGVPVRIELGPRDLDAGQVTIARRDTAQKSQSPLDTLDSVVPALLEAIQENLYRQAESFRDEHTFRPKDYAEMARLLEDPGGFMVAGWCGEETCEQKVKAETKATIRYLPLEPAAPDGPCIVCGSPAVDEAAWAQAY
ncbi:MAG: proline--tRNA ligase anticodon binding domain-containing protein, partial [Actinomycetota bacterium]